MTRAAGILLPIFSLPSPYGIGTLGKAAYDFADFLHTAGQTCWQMLPLGPTTYGDSPYQSFSAFAGNPYFVDLDLLAEDGLLTREEVDAASRGGNPRYVDYTALYESRPALLRRAYERGWTRDTAAVEAFRRESPWLEDYALYMACREHFGERPWTRWPEDIRLRRPEAMDRYRRQLQDTVAFYSYVQFLFYKQWAALRSYLKTLGITVIGDVPIYVPMDSVDVWAEPQFFQLDEKGFPLAVGGVPPDYFSEDGQLWGNPLYNWDAMERDGFGWWIRRIEGARKLYDRIRIDHFRGFAQYWSIPAGEKTAKNGSWCQGPGMKLVSVLSSWFYDVAYIAEDLGVPSPEVSQLLRDSHWPGMKVLEFAFDDPNSDSYQPHAYERSCVCYTGTHDNAPLRQWQQEAAPAVLARAMDYFAAAEDTLPQAMLRGGMGSVADLFIAQMQDYLDLGVGHRTNVPGTVVGNWQWRLLPGEAAPALAENIYRLTALYGRCEKQKKAAADNTRKA